LNNKSDLLKKSGTILLATVLVAGFIGISTPFSIFAQEYYDDYESEEYSQYYNDEYATEYNSYEKYMKNDNPKSIFQKINCDNINKNSPDSVNLSDEPESTNGEGTSSSDASRVNPGGFSDQGVKFLSVCQNNNNVNNIFNTFNNGDNSFSFVHNNTLTQNQNASYTTTISCGNNFNEGDNTINQTVVSIGNNITCSLTQNVTQIGSITDNTENNLPGVISTSSIADVEQPLAKTQQINPFETDNGISIQQQGKEDSPKLTAMEKVEKLKTQWLDLLP
jgi:hypothetical protein